MTDLFVNKNKSNTVRVLGIESSCDETGLAIYCSKNGLLSHALHSQISLHKKFGGVVPEIASRNHIEYLIPLLDEVLDKAKLQKKDIDAIAYTAGPGLIGALLTGACFAKSLAFALDIPAIAINHLEAHILVAQLESPAINFPFLSLLVSGGHTLILHAESLGKYTLLGETLDDAVGEAFDKTAKLMGLDYPGGKYLAALADSAQDNNYTSFPAFPRPMTDRPGLDFSFSGLKTHALNCWHNSNKDTQAKIGIAKEFQEAIIDTLLFKCKRAVKSTHSKQLVIAGGVSANSTLRKKFNLAMQDLGVETFFPSLNYCTDNGVMVAYTGYLYLQAGKQDPDLAISVKARWPID